MQYIDILPPLTYCYKLQRTVILGYACMSIHCEYYIALLFSHLTNCVISAC